MNTEQKLRDMLQEAVLQIEYMQGKFTKTGSGESVISKAKTLLSLPDSGISYGVLESLMGLLESVENFRDKNQPEVSMSEKQHVVNILNASIVQVKRTIDFYRIRIESPAPQSETEGEDEAIKLLKIHTAKIIASGPEGCRKYLASFGIEFDDDQLTSPTARKQSKK